MWWRPKGWFVKPVSCFLVAYAALVGVSGVRVRQPSLYRSERMSSSTPHGNSVIYYYGYFNNEHYQHWMPVKSDLYGTKEQQQLQPLQPHDMSTQGIEGSSVSVACPAQSTVKILHAEYGPSSTAIARMQHNHANECAARDVTAAVQKLCHKKAVCQIKVSAATLVSQSPCPHEQNVLDVRHSCLFRRTPLPLFDDRTRQYRRGVTPQFLVLSDFAGFCPPNRRLKSLVSPQLPPLFDACTPPCSWIGWNELTHHALLCSATPPGTVSFSAGPPYRQPGMIMAIPPSRFSVPDFAVYVNTQAVCESPALAVDQQVNVTWTESVENCRQNTDCVFFTYALVFSEEPNIQFKSLSCKGNPVFFPNNGWLTAIKAPVGV